MTFLGKKEKKDNRQCKMYEGQIIRNGAKLVRENCELSNHQYYR